MEESCNSNVFIERERNVAYTFDLNKPMESECNVVLRELHDFHVTSERVPASLRGGIVKSDLRREYPSVQKLLGPFFRKSILDLERIRKEKPTTNNDPSKQVIPKSLEPFFRKSILDSERIRKEEATKKIGPSKQVIPKSLEPFFRKSILDLKRGQKEEAEKKIGPPKQVNIDFSYASEQWNKNKFRDGKMIRYHSVMCGQLTSRGTTCKFDRDRCIYHRPRI